MFLEHPKSYVRWTSNWFGTDPFYRVLLYKCSQMRGTDLNVSKRSKLNAFFLGIGVDNK